MEQGVFLLGLVASTLGLPFFTHGFIGKTARGGLKVTCILIGSVILWALMAIMWSFVLPGPSPFSFVVYGSVVYGFTMVFLWGTGKPYTPTLRGLIEKLGASVRDRKFALNALLFILLMAGVTALNVWDKNKFTDVAYTVDYFLRGAIFWTCLGLIVAAADMIKRLMRRMPEPLLCIVGGTLLSLGTASFMIPAIFISYHIPMG